MNNFHNQEAKTVINKLKSNENGLAQTEAEKRIKKNGLNEIPKEKSISSLMVFILQFNNSLVYILIMAGVLSLILGAKIDACVIFGAVFINVIIGFFQENKANKAISKLKELVEHKAFVMRDGQEITVFSSQITVGDIILIKAGNRIPADARLIEAIDLQINEASLTGESLPSRKKIEKVLLGAALADRENMVYAGTMAVRGLGQAVVTAIGKDTELGKIAELVSKAKEAKTPLQIRLGAFSRFLSAIFAAVCFVIVIIGLAQNRPFLEMVETGVAVGVASIPEGLTVAVTFILALGMQQILRKRALTRKLVAAETLGSTTVICTDKTGTLTEGKMHVAHIIIGEKEFEFNTFGSRQDQSEALAVSLALQTGMMCNDAVIENPQDELASWRIIGTPTEAALLSAAVQSGLSKRKLLKVELKIDELPFDSAKKYMLSLHKKDDKNFILYEKGAPERLLEKSSFYYHLGGIKKITQEAKEKLNKTYENLTGRGLRVIGLAKKDIKIKSGAKEFKKGEVGWNEINREMIFIGFIAIKDPLRAEAKETIELCRRAGIRPIVITGDHKLTARAIAEEVGLKVKAENIITGDILDTIDDEKLKTIVNNIDLYARVSPHHKLRIVKALRNRGEVVAMTGDGINDSPALKAADIGIALGTGTDIAKETSDLILLDDNFKTIVSAVRQGRIIFKNIRKVITFLISDSFSEIILIVGSILLNTPLAILPAQILWINIVNDGMPHFSLAFEKDHGTVMAEKPIKKNEPLLSMEMKKIIFIVGIIRDLLIFILFFVLWQMWQGDPYKIAYLRTLIFAILGTKSLFGIFSLRAFHTRIWRLNIFKNKYLIFAVLGSFTLLLLGIYWSPLQKILSTVDLDLIGWAITFGIGIFSIALIELVKTPYIIKNKVEKVRVLGKIE
ncbi:MAG: HAD-IC family P-type ATPase [Patescibacteria group bacterium]|nr:HAD-IC family P-type ATPase [Patescibacteria group bacterium]